MMSRLLNPVPVLIQNVDTSNTVVDDVFGEADEVLYLEPIQVMAQVKDRESKRNYSRSGLQNVSSGSLLMYFKDGKNIILESEVNEELKTLEPKVLQIAGEEVEYFITESKPIAHIGGKATLMKFFYREKKVGE